MTQASQTTTRTLTDLASRICSPFLYIGELFADILEGGKAYSYRVPSDITPADCKLIEAFCHSLQSFSPARGHCHCLSREVSSPIHQIFESKKLENLYTVDSSTFLLCDTKGGEIE